MFSLLNVFDGNSPDKQIAYAAPLPGYAGKTDCVDFAVIDAAKGQPNSGSFQASAHDGKKILINTALDLYNMSYRVDGRNSGGSPDVQNPAAQTFYSGANYILADNIDYAEIGSNAGFITLGSSSFPFTGVFDGQGFNISNLYLEANARRVTLNINGTAYFAMFNNNAGTIQNLGLIKPVLNTFALDGGDYARVKQAYAAGLCGENNGTIQYCFVDNGGGAAFNAVQTAGICAQNGGTINNVYFAGSVSGADAAVKQPLVLAGNAVADAWYDNTLHTAGSLYGAGVATANLKARTSCLSADQWYMNNFAPYNAAPYSGYPRLAGMNLATGGSLKRPADIIYLGNILRDTTAGNYSFGTLTVTNDIDMSYVSEKAYKTPPAKFYGTINGAGGATNGAYSIMNLRIVTPYVTGTNVYTGFLTGVSNGTGTGVIVTNLNFVGGYVKPPVYYATTSAYSDYVYYTGMVAPYSAGIISLTNVHSSADVRIAERYGDYGTTDAAGNNTAAVSGRYTNIGRTYYAGGLIGGMADIATPKALNNVSFSGSINGGTHTLKSTAAANVYIGGIAGYYYGGAAATSTLTNVVNYSPVTGIQVVRNDWTYAATATVYTGGIFGMLANAFGAVSGLWQNADVWSCGAGNITENGSPVSVTASGTGAEITTNNNYAGGIMGSGPSSLSSPLGASIEFSGTLRAVEYTGPVVNAAAGTTLARTLCAGGIMGISSGTATYGGITNAGAVEIYNPTQTVNRTALYIGGVVSSYNTSLIIFTPNVDPIKGDVTYTSYSNNVFYASPLGSLSITSVTGYTLNRNIIINSPEAASVYAGGITAYGVNTNCVFSGALTVNSNKGGTMQVGGIGFYGTATTCTFSGTLTANNGSVSDTAVGAMYVGGMKYTGACTGTVSGAVNAFNYSANGMFVAGFTYGSVVTSGTMSGTVNAVNNSTSGIMYVGGFTTYSATTTSETTSAVTSGTMSGTVEAVNNSTSGAMYVGGVSYRGQINASVSLAAGAVVNAVNNSLTGIMYAGGVSCHGTINAAVTVSPGAVINFNNNTSSGAMNVGGVTYNGAINAAVTVPVGAVINANNKSTGNILAGGISCSGASTSGAGSVFAGTLNVRNYRGATVQAGGFNGSTGASTGTVFEGTVNYNPSTVGFTYDYTYNATTVSLAGVSYGTSAFTNVLSRGTINVGNSDAGATVRAATFNIGGIAYGASSMSNCVNRTVFNFTLCPIVATTVRIGGLAAYHASAGAWPNCVNYANINVNKVFDGTTTTVRMGGLAAEINYQISDAYINNSINYGNIYAETANSNVTFYIGGIAGVGGYTATYSSGMYNVVNKGNITVVGTPGSSSTVGGVAGSYGNYRSGYYTGFIRDSANFGNISCQNTSGSVRAGGIMGGGSNYQIVISGCVNTGSITQTGAQTNYLGGILGHNAVTTSPYAILNNNLNYGNVGAAQYSGGIVGNNTGTSLTLNNNINHGAVGTGTTGTSSLVCASGGIVGRTSTLFTLNFAINYGMVTAGTGSYNYSGGIIGHSAAISVTSSYVLYVYKSSGAASLRGYGTTTGSHSNAYTTNSAGDTSMGTVTYAPESNASGGIYHTAFPFRADERPNWGITMSDRANKTGLITPSAYVSSGLYYIYAVAAPENQTGGQSPDGRKYGEYLTENITVTLNTLAADTGATYNPAADIANANQITLARDCEIVTLTLTSNPAMLATASPKSPVANTGYANYVYYNGSGYTAYNCGAYGSNATINASKIASDISDAQLAGVTIPSEITSGGSFGYIYFYGEPGEFPVAIRDNLPQYITYLANTYTLSDGAVSDWSSETVSILSAGLHTVYTVIKVEQKDETNGTYAYKYWLLVVTFNNPVKSIIPINSAQSYLNAISVNGVNLSQSGSVSQNRFTVGGKPSYAPAAAPASATYFILDTDTYENGGAVYNAVAYDSTTSPNGRLRISFDTNGFSSDYVFRDAAVLKLYNKNWVQQTLNLTAISTTAYLTPTTTTANNAVITGLTANDETFANGSLFFEFTFPSAVADSIYGTMYYLVINVATNANPDYVIQFVKAPRPANTGADLTTTLTVRSNTTTYNTVSSFNATTGTIAMPYTYGDWFNFSYLENNWTARGRTWYNGAVDSSTMAANTATNAFFYALNLATASQYAIIYAPHKIVFETITGSYTYESFTAGTLNYRKTFNIELTRITVYFWIRSEDGNTDKLWTLILTESAPVISDVYSISLNSYLINRVNYQPFTVERDASDVFAFMLYYTNTPSAYIRTQALLVLAGEYIDRDGGYVLGDILPSAAAPVLSSSYYLTYTVTFAPSTRNGLYFIAPYMKGATVNATFSLPSLYNQANNFTRGLEIVENGVGLPVYYGANITHTHTYNWNDAPLAEFSIEKLANKDSYASGVSFGLRPKTFDLKASVDGSAIAQCDEISTPGVGSIFSFSYYSWTNTVPADPNRIKTIYAFASYTYDDESCSNRVSFDLRDNYATLWMQDPYTGDWVKVKWYDFTQGVWIDNTVVIPEYTDVVFRVVAENTDYFTDYVVRLADGVANKRIAVSVTVPTDFEGYLFVTLYTILPVINPMTSEVDYKLTRFTRIVFINSLPSSEYEYSNVGGQDYKTATFRLANHIQAYYSIEVKTVTGYLISYDAGDFYQYLHMDGEGGEFDIPELHDLYGGRPYLDVNIGGAQYITLNITLSHDPAWEDPWGIHFEDWQE